MGFEYSDVALPFSHQFEAGIAAKKKAVDDYITSMNPIPPKVQDSIDTAQWKLDHDLDNLRKMFDLVCRTANIEGNLNYQDWNEAVGALYYIRGLLENGKRVAQFCDSDAFGMVQENLVSSFEEVWVMASSYVIWLPMSRLLAVISKGNNTEVKS